eukprot:scaffold7040_cov256-Pinguiococcus_pyrenoidosus.AAC.16
MIGISRAKERDNRVLVLPIFRFHHLLYPGVLDQGQRERSGERAAEAGVALQSRSAQAYGSACAGGPLLRVAVRRLVPVAVRRLHGHGHAGQLVAGPLVDERRRYAKKGNRGRDREKDLTKCDDHGFRWAKRFLSLCIVAASAGGGGRGGAGGIVGDDPQAISKAAIQEYLDMRFESWVDGSEKNNLDAEITGKQMNDEDRDVLLNFQQNSGIPEDVLKAFQVRTPMATAHSAASR